MTFDVDWVFGESSFAAMVAEIPQPEKETGRKGSADVRLSCCFGEVRKIEKSGWVDWMCVI